MKVKRITRNTIISIVTGLTGVVCASAQTTTTWNGSGGWGSAGSWDNGVPDSTKDVIVTKSTEGQENLVPTTGFKSLTVTANTLTGDASTNRFIFYFNTGVTGGATSFIVTEKGLLTASLTDTVNPLNLSSLSLYATGDSEANGAVTWGISKGTTLNVSGGISLGSNLVGANNAYISYGNLGTGGGAIINADIIFNNGSRFWASSGNSQDSTININGNVTLQSGGYAGKTPYFSVGRADALKNKPSDPGLSIKIRYHLSVETGTVGLNKEKTLEVGSANFTSGGTLQMGGFLDAATDAVFRSIGDLKIDGGQLKNNTVANNQTSGGYVLDIGGNFILSGSDSTISLSNNALAITTMKLKGDFDLQATNLASGNLNELRLSLEGSSLQTLEAGVTDGNSIFTVHTLALKNSTFSLVDDYLNIAEGEYFKTLNLVNTGNSTLFLNGYQFFVGGTELIEGVYNTYGGTLTVASAIPEPSVWALMVGAFVGFLMFQRKNN